MGRFRVLESITAGAERLLELLEDAIREVDGDERETGQLREIVANVPFIPFPVSMSTPDKAKRISLGRIVAHSGAGTHAGATF